MRSSSHIACVVLIVAVSTRAAAQVAPPEAEPAPDVELSPEELADIEAATGADAAALAETQEPSPAGASNVAAALQSMNPDISFIVDVALAYFSEDENLQTGAHDPQETGFTLQQVEMAVGKAVDPYFRVDGNLVFSQFGVEIEEFYATTLALPWSLQARVGQFLTRVGRINATHPHTWDFVDQPFIIGRYFGAEGNRGLGTELSWLSPLPWYTELAVSVTDAAGEASARSFFGPEDLPVESPLDFQWTAVLEQFFELGPNWSLMWGLSAATGPNPSGHDNRTDVFGSDLYLKYRPITYGSYTEVGLQTEWFFRQYQIPDDRLTDHGGYAYAMWRFSKRWETAWRYEYGAPAENEDSLALGDPLDPAWTAGRHRYTGNVSFFPTEFSRIRLQASLDDPQWLDDPIAAVFAAFELSIGAHGAHEF